MYIFIEKRKSYVNLIKLATLILYFLFSGITITGFSDKAFGGDDFILISREKEKRMGASIAKQVEKKFDEVDDPLVQERFEGIAKRVADVCGKDYLVYHFKVLKPKEGDIDKYYNAFALPGGYVYMFEPMMKALKTDDRIAGVIAHELGHVCARHAAKRLQGNLGMSALMALAIIAARDGRSVMRANQALAQLMMAYSREDEFEADKLSVEYLKRAKFDPEGTLGGLLVLQKLRKKGRERRWSGYRGHPYLSERIAAARSEIKGYSDFNSYINLPKEKEDFL